MAGCEYGPDGKCGRRVCRQVDGKGICHSHRRHWLDGKPLDKAVRTYQRYGNSPDGVVRAVSVPSPRRRRRPFEAEHKLLKELGLL